MYSIAGRRNSVQVFVPTTLATIAEEEDWGGEVQVYRNQAEIDRALGTGRQPYGLLSVRWD